MRIVVALVVLILFALASTPAIAGDALAYSLPAKKACPASRQFLASQKSKELDRILAAIAERGEKAGDALNSSRKPSYADDLWTLFETARVKKEDVLITALSVCRKEGKKKKVRVTTIFERQGKDEGLISVKITWPEKGFPEWEARTG